MFQCMHVQNHAYANKSRGTYICNLCQLSDPDNMVILPQIIKITFEKSENVDKKIFISQNLAKILTENRCFS